MFFFHILDAESSIALTAGINSTMALIILLLLVQLYTNHYNGSYNFKVEVKDSATNVYTKRLKSFLFCLAFSTVILVSCIGALDVK